MEMEMAMDMSVNLGLTLSGKCDDCANAGPRFKFYNRFAEPAIEKNLCPICMRKAMKCVGFFFRTPAGIQAVRKMGEAEGLK